MKNLAIFFGLTKRNRMVYLKDHATVFFSLLAPIIVLGLYLLFLKDTYVSSIQGSLAKMGLDIAADKIDPFINSWLISGLLGTSCITIPLSSLSALVYDREHHINDDFASTPAPKGIVLLSYLISSFINTFIITAIILTFGFILLACQKVPFTFGQIVAGYAVLALGSLSGTSIMMLIMSLFKKGSTVGAFTGIVCAAVGFFIGAYMPIAEFDEWIQVIANLLPGSHVCGLMRNVLMTPSLNLLNESIGSVEFVNEMIDFFGIKMTFFGGKITTPIMVLYTSGSIILFILLDIFVYKKTSIRK